MTTATSPTATFCSTLVDQWVRMGVTSAMAAPGSRLTPLLLALANEPRVRIEIFHDERAASFAAVGYGRAAKRPAVLVCTSGTAAAHFHGAVIEAGLSDVPLLVCTADRPPELWDFGAPQTVDQTHLYGRAVRWFVEPGVQNESLAPTWRALASRMVMEANGASGRCGPVHANLSFADPLVGEPGELPPASGAPQVPTEESPSDALVGDVAHRLDRKAGVIVAGAGTPDPRSVLTLGESLGWPVIADHRSGARAPGRAVGHADSLLRCQSFGQDRQAEVVLRFGEQLSSKVLNQWIADQATAGAEVISAVPGRRWIDPDRHSTVVVPARGLATELIKRVGATTRGDRGAWLDADETAAHTIAHWCQEHPNTEPAVARNVVETIKPGTELVVASSMPVRLVEWFGPNRTDISVVANRGANGIDGTVATGIGVAMASVSPTVVLVGDVGFLHDSTALIGAAQRGADLTVVVINNNGGGIFSFLPQATEVDPTTFERLFGTPHHVDLEPLVAAHGIPFEPWNGAVDSPLGVSVVEARTGRPDVVTDQQALHREVAAALAA